MAKCRRPGCEDDALPGKLYCAPHRTVGLKGYQRSNRPRGGIPGTKGRDGDDGRSNPGNPEPETPSRSPGSDSAGGDT